jgi:hypothetical protein
LPVSCGLGFLQRRRFSCLERFYFTKQMGFFFGVFLFFLPKLPLCSFRCGPESEVCLGLFLGHLGPFEFLFLGYQ